MNSRNLVFFVSFLLVITSLQGQQLAYFPTQSVFSENTAQFTSAIRNTNESEVTTGGIFGTGIFKDFRKFYLSGLITSKDSTKRHAAGIVILRDEIGELITETQIEGLYRIFVPISDQVKLGLGTHVGMYQLGLEASSTTSGDISSAFNVSVSGGVMSDRWEAGVFLRNIPQPDFQVLNSDISLERVAGVHVRSKLAQMAFGRTDLSLLCTRIAAEWCLTANIDQSFYDKYLAGIQLGSQSFGGRVAIENVQVSSRFLMIALGYQYSYEAIDVGANNRIQLMVSIQ